MVFHLRWAFSSFLLISLIVIAESQECDCGNNTISCEFKDDIKECTCSEGYLPINGSCQSSKCDCGRNSLSCILYGDNIKNCTCKPGFVQFDSGWKHIGDQCYECDCGNGSTNCHFDDGFWKNCSCRFGYAALRRYSKGDDSCKECSCGEDTVSCELDSEEGRHCMCGGDSIGEYQPLTGERLCKKCNCGPFSHNCTVENGEQKCECIEGSYPVYNSSIQFVECSKPWEDVKSAPPSGWEVATYVLSAAVVAVLITMVIQLIIIKRKQ